MNNCLKLIAVLLLVFSLALPVSANSLILPENNGEEGGRVTAESPETAEETQENTGDGRVTAEESPEVETIPKASLEEIYSEYKQVLIDNKYMIDRYTWQFYGEGAKPAQCNIADVTGDDIPELIITYAPETDDNYFNFANLAILTYDNGQISTLYDEILDYNAGGGTRYCLFRTEDNSVYMYVSLGDEWWTKTYYEFCYNEEEERYFFSPCAIYQTGPNDDYSEWINTYFIYDEEVTEEEYYSFEESLVLSMSEVLLHNQITYEGFIADAADENPVTSGTAMDMIVLCNDKLMELDSEAEGDPKAFLKYLPQYFTFASGVGNWATDIHVNADGSFTGSYYDMNMGEGGDGYMATEYLCNFTGKFKNFKKIDDFTYSCELKNVKCDIEPGTEEIVDITRYVYTEPYGVENGKTFYFYLPGKEVSTLPEGFIDWARWQLGDTSSLDFYGLYNSDQEYGFTGQFFSTDDFVPNAVG